MSIRSMLRSLATIQRATTAATTFSSAGTKTWATLYADVPCDIQPGGSRGTPGATETILYGGEQSVVRYRMYCLPAHVPLVTAGDRVLFNGRYFEIMGVRDTDEVSRLVTLDLLEIKGRTVD